ncbi:hypothetical protein Q1W71_21440 [Flavobacterium pectinovorum]|uniref:hypothetical protein n=1 Tax=Flavobacterium pectinovorum TaxID=29533 RepID=UPI002660441E|nr:hypothetical protein [Flavobacterium pectinovorum]WKL47509.1 hypothetical protein Q1W71_21440 [Flavobacterium pectinovorum]
MKEQKTILHNYYFVNSKNTPVTLEVITGSVGQTSAIDAKIEGVLNIENANGGISETTIGENKSLQGRTLIISCTITDTSRDTNYTELRVRLRGGVNFAENQLFFTVENEGESVNYQCIIHLVKP